MQFNKKSCFQPTNYKIFSILCNHFSIFLQHSKKIGNFCLSAIDKFDKLWYKLIKQYIGGIKNVRRFYS